MESFVIFTSSAIIDQNYFILLSQQDFAPEVGAASFDSLRNIYFF